MASAGAIVTPVGAVHAACGLQRIAPTFASTPLKLQAPNRCIASSVIYTTKYSSRSFRTSERCLPTRTRPLTVRATSSAVPLNPDSGSQDPLESQEGLHLPFSTRWAPKPTPLPPPPKDTSLINVLPFLWSLASADVSLRWRLGFALVLLVAGKVQGSMGRVHPGRSLLIISIDKNTLFTYHTLLM